MLTLGASHNATIIAPENTFHLVQHTLESILIGLFRCNYDA